MSRQALISCVLMLSVTLHTGCKREQPTPLTTSNQSLNSAKNGSGPAIGTEENAAPSNHIGNKQGESMPSNATIEANNANLKFLGDILYPGAKPTKAAETKSRTEKAFYTSSDSFETVCLFYESTLGKSGSMKIVVDGKKQAIYTDKRSKATRIATITQAGQGETTIELTYNGL